MTSDVPVIARGGAAGEADALTGGVAIVLLVEDSAADADLTREALSGSRITSELYVVGDGVEALAFLRRSGRWADAPRPDLVLLDLHLPLLDGPGVLAELKRDPALHDIPVVVLSSSSEPGDVASAYGLRANCYVTKPPGLTQYLATVRAIEQFWLEVAAPPPRRAHSSLSDEAA